MAAVDLHFHLLPGVDDGPAEMADSLELASAAVADGTRTVVTTPHVRTDFFTAVHELPQRVSELRAALAHYGIPLELRCGGELGHDMVGRLPQGELELIAQGPPSARWLLVEAPFEGFGEDFHAATEELRERGFGVLIAHPERSADAVLAQGAGLRREFEAGSLAQVNALSLSGGHGGDAEQAAWRLIDEYLVAVVSSDAHGPSRPPALRLAERCLVEHGAPAKLAQRLTTSAARGLLARGIASRAALAA
ncbi:MAG TPA: CpsB/CapC family capsule biosynthesis tyrosine phosphatase [Thermoleophilaceae bacterium]|nr:CpsB/CapC family capsule biosynthesis tyrosine phosphatase [Thermoleophilaceae bacterium]